MGRLDGFENHSKGPCKRPNALALMDSLPFWCHRISFWRGACLCLHNENHGHDFRSLPLPVPNLSEWCLLLEGLGKVVSTWRVERSCGQDILLQNIQSIAKVWMIRMLTLHKQKNFAVPCHRRHRSWTPFASHEAHCSEQVGTVISHLW